MLFLIKYVMFDSNLFSDFVIGMKIKKAVLIVDGIASGDDYKISKTDSL